MEQGDTVIDTQYLVLNIGEHHFAANVANIEDVIKSRKTTPVPLSKPNITGLLNLRGHIVTEIDVAMTLDIQRPPPADGGLAVVIMLDDEFYSLTFDGCLLYTSPSPRDRTRSRMPSSA